MLKKKKRKKNLKSPDQDQDRNLWINQKNPACLQIAHQAAQSNLKKKKIKKKSRKIKEKNKTKMVFL